MAITEKVKKKIEGVTEDLKESIDTLKEDVNQIKERLKDIVPVKKRKSSLPIWKAQEDPTDPFRMLQLRTNQLFEEFYQNFGRWSLGRWSPFGETTPFFEANWPRVDISETEKEVIVKAELPGVDEEDIEIYLSDDLLTIRGDKKIEQEDKGRDYHRVECFHGSFTRSIPIPALVEANKAEASFKKHVLTVKLPKIRAEQEKGVKIEIKTN